MTPVISPATGPPNRPDNAMVTKRRSIMIPGMSLTGRLITTMAAMPMRSPKAAELVRAPSRSTHTWVWIQTETNIATTAKFASNWAQADVMSPSPTHNT